MAQPRPSAIAASPELRCAVRHQACNPSLRATTAGTRDATIEAIGQMEKALTSLTSLLAQTEELQRRIADLQRQSRSGAIAHVKTMMAEHKLSIADIEAKDAKDRANAQRIALKTVVSGGARLPKSAFQQIDVDIR